MEVEKPTDIFEEVRKDIDCGNADKAQNAKTLAAIEEAIHGKKAEAIEPDQYFTTLLSRLQLSKTVDRSLIYLFQMVLPHVSEKLKQKRGAECLETLLKIPKENKDKLQRAVYHSLLSCITEVLLSQKTKESVWNDGVVKKASMYLVSMCTDRTAKVRKHAHDELSRLLVYHSQKGFKLTSQFVVNYLDTLVTQFDEEDHRELLYLCIFLSSNVLSVSPSLYSSMISTLLPVCSHNVSYMRQYIFKMMGEIFRCEKYTDESCISSTLTKLLASPVKASASEDEIMGFVAAVDAACIRLLKSKHEGVEKLFLEATRIELQLLPSADASVQTLLSQELFSFYSSVPPVPPSPSPHPQSLSSTTATSLATSLVAAVTAQKAAGDKKVGEPLFHTLAGGATLLARGCPAALSPVFRLLFGLHASGAITARPQIEAIFGDCLEAMGLEAFLEQASITKKDSALPDDAHSFLLRVLAARLAHMPCSLAFFFDTWACEARVTNRFLPMIKACQKEEGETKNFTQKRQLQRVVKDICSVFVSCCVCCSDASLVLGRYKKALLHILGEKGYAEAGVEIAKGFAVLVRSAQRSGKEEEAKEEEMEDFDDLAGTSGAADATDAPGATGMSGTADATGTAGTAGREEEENDELDPDSDPSFLSLLADSRAPALTPDVAEKNLAAVAAMAEPLLQALGKLYESCHGSFEDFNPATGMGKGGELAQTLVLRSVMMIVCRVAPVEVAERLFQQTASALEEAMEKDDSDVHVRGQRVVLAGKLAVVLPRIPAGSVEKAMSVVELHLDEASVGALQRRFYYCLLLLCRYHAGVFERAGKIPSMTQTLLQESKAANAMVRKFRIKCLLFLWRALDPAKEASVALIVATLPQLVLWIKDANEKVRSICFECLVCLARVMDQSTVEIDLPTGEKTPCSLLEFFKMLIGCMAASSPRMKSASLMCLSYVIYHYRGNPAIWPLVCHHMHVVYGVLDDKNRELIKACFGFIRTCVKVMPEEALKEELHDVVLTMLPWANDPKNRFKLRVRGIIELAVRRMGKETVLNEVPESEREKVLGILSNKPKQSNEELVKEMEVEAAKLAKEDEYDDKEVVEIDEKGDVKGGDEVEALIQEIAKSDDFKRAVERREEMEEEEEEMEEEVEGEEEATPSKVTAKVTAKVPAKMPKVIAKMPAKSPVKEEKKEQRVKEKKEKRDKKSTDKKEKKEKKGKKEMGKK